jgi:hypothetical protein
MHPIEWLRAVARSGVASPHDLAGEAAAALAALADEPHDLVPACRRLLDRHPSVATLWWTCARMVAAADPSAEADAIVRDLDAEQTGLSLTLDLPDGATVTVVGWTELADELAVRRGDLRILAVVDDTGGGAGGGRRSRWSLWEDSDDSAQDEVVVVPGAGLGAAVRASDVVLAEALAVGADRVVAASGTLAAVATARQLGDTEVWLAVGVGRRLPNPLLGALEDRVFSAADEDREPWKAGVDRFTLGLVDRVVEPLAIPCPAPPELLRSTGRR